MNDARFDVEGNATGVLAAGQQVKEEALAGLAMMSHEIRTPLNAMLGMLDLVRQTGLTAEQAEYLDLMQDTGQSLLALVNDILDCSRIEAGQFELEQLPFSLRACLGATVNLLKFEALRKGLGLVCHIDRDIPDALLGDPMRLRQILVNLLGNAIKFSEHGDIVLHVALQAGNADELSCQFSIRDQGIGIPAEQQGCIFSPYRQVDRSIARRYGGSGLGLSIAAQLVAMMNGTIWLDSAPGQGSTFYFTACFDRQTPVARAPAPAMAPGVPLCILLVEDNPTNRRLAQITLEKAGHRVIPADSGAAALRLLQSEQPDLILMDLQMPAMDGLQTTAAIRQRESLLGGHTPIIALSAHALPADRARCLKAGMDDYLGKPVSPAALLACHQRLAKPATQSTEHPRRCHVLDRASLFLRVNDDRHLLGEIRDIFLRDCAPLMQALRLALAAHDSSRFKQCAHTLRGMFRSLAANAAEAVVGQLEELDLAHPRLAVAYARLEYEVRMLKNELQDMLRNARASRPSLACLSSRTRNPPARARPASIQGKPKRSWKGIPRLGLRGADRRFEVRHGKGASQ